MCLIGNFESLKKQIFINFLNNFLKMAIKESKEEVKGVGGWLSFFIFTSCMSIILNFIVGIEEVSSIVSDTEVLASTKLWLVPLDTLLFIGLIGFTVYTIFSLIKLRPNAVSLAKMYLILTFLTNLMGMIFSGVTGELQLLDVMAMFELLAELLAMVIAGVIWFLYLTYSKRVNNTYPKEKRESYAIDKVFFFSILAIPLVIYLLAFVGTTYETSLNSTIQNIEIKRTLAENEYSDGRIFFMKPLNLEIEKDYSGVAPFFILSKDEEMSINIISDLVDIDHKEYFNSLYKVLYDGLRQGYELDTTIIKYEQTTNANGFQYIKKSIRIEGEDIFIWTVIVIFDNASNKTAEIVYFAPQSKNSIYSSYLDEVTNSIKFS